jgi:hypothetical protein
LRLINKDHEIEENYKKEIFKNNKIRQEKAKKGLDFPKTLQ